MNKKRSPYETVLVLLLASVVLFLMYRHMWILWAGLALAVPAVLFPVLAKYIDYAWSGLGRMMGAVTGKVLLTLIYVLLLLPLSLLFRKRISMNISKKNGSLFKERNHRYTRKDLEKVW